MAPRGCPSQHIQTFGFSRSGDWTPKVKTLTGLQTLPPGVCSPGGPGRWTETAALVSLTRLIGHQTYRIRAPPL